MEVLAGACGVGSASGVNSQRSEVLPWRATWGLVGGAGVAMASLMVSSSAALALRYEDVVSGVEKASSAAESFSVVDFDAAADFMSDNPMALVAGLAAVAVPVVAFRALGGPQSFGSVSAKEAFSAMSKEGRNAQLLDIRSVEDVRAEGNPSLKSLKKRPVRVAYTGDDANLFQDQVLAKVKDPETTTLYILDRLDGNSLAAAKILADSGFEGAYAIRGGVAGWKKSELPWLLPRKGLFDGLKDILNGSDASTVVPTTIGVAAAAGIGATFFSEAETVLQLLGSVAFVQIFAKKFMFAKDREQTIKEITSFLDTKVVPEGLSDDLKEVGRVLLPKDSEVKAAVASGEKELEKKNLKVDSGVTPPAVGEKVAETVGAQVGESA